MQCPFDMICHSRPNLPKATKNAYGIGEHSENTNTIFCGAGVVPPAASVGDAAPGFPPATRRPLGFERPTSNTVRPPWCSAPRARLQPPVWGHTDKEKRRSHRAPSTHIHMGRPCSLPLAHPILPGGAAAASHSNLPKRCLPSHRVGMPQWLSERAAVVDPPSTSPGRRQQGSGTTPTPTAQRPLLGRLVLKLHVLSFG